MRRRVLKACWVSLLSMPLGCLCSHGAEFSTDFNSGLPPGSAVAGTAVVDSSGGIGNSGVLKLTINAGGQQGAYYVNDFAGGAAVNNFRVAARVAIGGGTARPADGMAFCFGTDLPAPPATFGEEGAGSGICVTFDTWDNNAPDTAPAMEVRYGGAVVAFQSMAGIREGGRAPDGPILTDSAGNPVSLETFGPASQPTDAAFVNVVIELFSDNTISVSFSNVVVFNHLPIPYTPISGGTWAFGARTGGATDDHWIDNLTLLANYTPAPVTAVTGPSNQAVFETQRATFSVTTDGTPPVSAQWFRNGLAIPGATELTYVTPPATLAMNGDIYRVEVRNSLNATPIVSPNATLTVSRGLVLVSASNRTQSNRVYVTFSKAVARTGTYTISPSLAVISVSPGATPEEVVLNTAPQTLNTTYTLTVNGETGTDGSILIPNPSTTRFHFGFGPFCYDFNDNVLPPGSALIGSATLTGGIIHLTDAGVAGACGDFWIADRLGGTPLDRLQARWSSLIGNGGGGGADGYSFSWGSDIPLPSTCTGSEEGAGSGLSVTVDTFDNGGGEVGIEIKWRGQRVAFQQVPKDDPGNGIYLRKAQFVDASVEVLPNGQATFNYDGIIISAALAGFAPISGGNFLFAGRTGGANDDQWVDNVRINCFTLAPPVFTLQPVNTSVIEGDAATFIVSVDGAPPLSLQWFTNGVPVPGAITSRYTTPPGTLALNGLQVSVTAANQFGTTSSSNATLRVIPAPRIVSCSMGCRDDQVHIVFTKPVRLDGTYSTDVTIVNGVSYGASQSEVILDIDPLPPGTTANVTIQDVHDQGGNVQFPNPTTCRVNYGFGRFCADFNDNQAPPGTTLGGNAPARIADGILHLTDDAQNGVCGYFFIPDQTGGSAVDRLHAHWRSLIGGVDQPGEATQFGTGGADGYSFNWGSDVRNACDGGPEGTGTGVTVTVDTFDNGGGEAPGIEMKYKGQRVAFSPAVPGDQAAAKAFLRKGMFVDAEVNVIPDGTATFTYDGITISAKLPNFVPIVGGNFSFVASTGGAQDNHWIDDLCINDLVPDNLGPLMFCSNVVAECAGGLTPVSYTVLAVDFCDGPVSVTCTPPSGTGFRLGASNVVCTARDSANNPSSCTFTVTVVDTTPPTVSCPSNITASATGPDGAVVTYTASATDPCGLSSLACTPPSGSTFPLGTTTVVCTAVDGSANTNSCSFTIAVSQGRPPVCVIGVHCTLNETNDTNAKVVALDGNEACAVLDASGSSDPDGDPLQFTWIVDGTNTYTGPVVTVCLELGCHTVALVVSDGGAVSRCETNVCAIIASESVEECVELVDNSDIVRKNKRPLIASLKAAAASFDRGNFIAGMNQLEAFQNKVNAQIAPDNPAEAAAFIECAQKILDAIDCGANAGLNGRGN